MDVRRLGPQDWALWRDVRLAALADSPRAFGSTLEREQAFDEDRWRAWLEPAKGLKAVARESEGTAGIVGVWVPEDRDGAGELFSMWVHPAWRGRGAGDLLVTEAIAWAGERGLTALDLWVVGDNVAARRLYERHGFRPTGEAQPYPPDPSVVEYVMRCEIS
ncbi:GNAT family N-acetyltransferase [Dactylosporangium sp. CA-052675]|uniref:GNAT family N-acetyltransferase n=1 Tax=Dactylosporangium sp. CA-052675 TaxID=3239927 RepID=UPI003D944A5E